MSNLRLLLLFVVLATTLPTSGSRANGSPEPPKLAGSVSDTPRVMAQSDLFELVGVVENGAMTIFLDRYHSNEPVLDAKVEVEAGSVKAVTSANADGTYLFKNAVLTQPGQLPITFSIAAGSDSDLLAGELVIADPSATQSSLAGRGYQRWWLTAAAFALVAFAVWWWARGTSARKAVR